MEQTWLYLSDKLYESTQWLQFLKSEGYVVVRRNQWEEVESLIQTGVVNGIFFEGESNTPIWEVALKLVQSHPQHPFAFALPSRDSGVEQIEEDELHIFLYKFESKRRKRHLLKTLLKFGSLQRKLKDMEQQPKQTALHDCSGMFDSMEINSVIDRILSHFGPIAPARNLHWVSESELHRLLTLEEEAFRLELQHRFGTNPLLRSYKEEDLGEVHRILRKLPWPKERLESGEAFLQWRVFGRIQALVPVEDKRKEKTLGYFLFEDLETEVLDFLVDQMRAGLAFMLPVIEMGFRCWEAENQGFLDLLTPLYNQKFLHIAIDSEINRCKRTGGEFTVLFLDIDYFKQINDTRGHWIGSEVIRQLGKLLFQSIRSCDYGFRYGGDEFVILLPGTGVEAGEGVAERIRRDIAHHSFEIEGQEVKLTVSIGIAAFPRHGKTKEEIIKIADQAMYHGKNMSRNVVYLAS